MHLKINNQALHAYINKETGIINEQTRGRMSAASITEVHDINNVHVSNLLYFTRAS